MLRTIVVVVVVSLVVGAFADCEQKRIRDPIRNVAFPSKLAAEVQSSPACPNDICPGMGNGFSLWKINSMSIKTGGSVFFKNKALGSCVIFSNVTQAVRTFSSFDSMQEFTSKVMAEADLSGSFASSALSAQGTAQAIASKSSSMTSSFHSVQMDIQVVTHSLDFEQSTDCFTRSNLDEQFLKSFESLPLIDSSKVGDSSSWNAYVQFLSNSGSHIMWQQLIGSRFQLWESTESSSSDIDETLQIKACAEVEGGTDSDGWSVKACAGYNSAQKQKAMKLQTNMLRIINGGTEETRGALTQDVNKASLNAFIASAPDGNQPIRFMFKPIWELLYSIFAIGCSDSGPGSSDCKSLQRAVTLQATYEGWLSIPCQRLEDGRGNVYQTMEIAGKDNLGINTYRCALSKTGCRDDYDCFLGGAGSVCYCYGPGCIDKGDKIPLVDDYYNKIRGEKHGAYDGGVNNSCYYKFISHCNCDKSWSGGLRLRYPYLQSLQSASTLQDYVCEDSV